MKAQLKETYVTWRGKLHNASTKRSLTNYEFKPLTSGIK
jgi:hypothetical protein